MPEAHEQFAEAERLLKEGKVQEAADLLNQAAGDAKAAAIAAGTLTPEPEKELSPEELMYELLHAISERIGHPPRVQQLLEQIRQRLFPPAPAAAKEDKAA